MYIYIISTYRLWYAYVGFLFSNSIQNFTNNFAIWKFPKLYTIYSPLTLSHFPFSPIKPLNETNPIHYQMTCPLEAFIPCDHSAESVETTLKILCLTWHVFRLSSLTSVKIWIKLLYKIIQNKWKILYIAWDWKHVLSFSSRRL